MTFKNWVARATVTMIVAGTLGAGCWSPRLEPTTVKVESRGQQGRQGRRGLRVRVGKFVSRGDIAPDKVSTLRKSVVRSLKASGFVVRKDREQVQIAVVVDRFRDRQFKKNYGDRELLTALLSFGFFIPLWERQSLGEIRVILFATFPKGRVVRRVFAGWYAGRCRIGLFLWGVPYVTDYCRQVYRRAQQDLIQQIVRELRLLIDQNKRPHKTGRASS